MNNKNEVKIVEYRDCIGGYGIPCTTRYHKMRTLRVKANQKDLYIKELGLELLRDYDKVLDWLVLNFYTQKKY